MAPYVTELNGGPRETRTPDRQLRRLPLYPTELWGRFNNNAFSTSTRRSLAAVSYLCSYRLLSLAGMVKGAVVANRSAVVMAEQRMLDAAGGFTAIGA